MKKIGKKYNKFSTSLRASFWFLFANIFQKSIMIIFTPVFTRVMTTEEYSKYALFQSWETIFTVFATLGISNYATAKALVEYKDDRDIFVSSAEFLTIVLTICTFGIYLVIRFVFGGFSDFPIYIMVLLFADIIAVAVFAFWSQVERFNLKYKALAILSVLMGIFSPLIAFLFIVFSEQLNIYKGWARIFGLVFINCIVGVFIYFLSYKKSGIFFSVKYWKFCFVYCVPLIPHFLATAFLQRISQIFVDNYCGSEISGVYALANTLSMLMMVVNDAFTKTLVPWTYQKLSDKKYSEINNPVLLALVIICVVDLGMAFVAPEIVAIFADIAYKQAIYAIPPLVAVCYFSFLYNIYANIEYYYKETKLVSLSSVIAGIVIVLLNFLLVPEFGFIASAYSSLLSYIIYAIMHYVFMKKTIKKHLNRIGIYNNLLILKISILFLFFILCMPFFYQVSVIRYILIIVSCLVLVVNYKKLYCLLKSYLGASCIL